MKYNALKKQEVIDVIEGKGVASRIPVALHFWNTPEAFSEDKIEIVRKISDQYPSDIVFNSFAMPQAFTPPDNDSSFRWINYKLDNNETQSHGLDSNNYIKDIEEEIDLFINNMPNADYVDLFKGLPLNTEGRYSVCHWWYGIFERHWWLRGMENALTDFYIYKDETHKLYRALTDFYKKIIIRAKKELNVDGIFISDDIGTQTGSFFSIEIFREFLKPYYEEIIRTAHENGMHFWLHSCGNIEDFIPEFIEIGLDVLHPIQKYTMEEAKIAKKYGDKICIWAGFDVQQIIPYGSKEDVLKEVSHLIDTYYRSDGRLMLTAGNGITGDCPIESLEALYDGYYRLGSK